MNSKDEIIDWLVSNDELVLEIIEKTNARLIDHPVEFKDEVRDQRHDIIQSELVNEITKQWGIPCDEVHEMLEDGRLELYISYVQSHK